MRWVWVEVPEDQRTSTSSDRKDLEMDERTSCCHGAGGYCDRCDLLVDLPGLHVIGVEHDTADRVVVTVESPPGPIGARSAQWSRPGTART